jgi:hypothetical protein
MKTFHEGAVIAITLTEADDAEREKRRTQLHQPDTRHSAVNPHDVWEEAS